MTRRPTLRLMALAVLLWALLAGCADTSSPELTGRYSLTVVTEHEHILAADQVGVGPLVVAGGTVVLEPGTQHQGTVLALAGDLVVQGTVDGDLLALGGDVTLTEGSVVTGDLQQAGGTLDRQAGAQVGGRVVQDADVGQVLGGTSEDAGDGWAGRLLWLVVTVVAAAAAAALLVRLAPAASARVRDAGTHHPVVSGALGTLVLVMAPALVVSMVFTVLLVPLALVLLVLLGGLVAYGLLGLGRGLGERLTRRRATSPVRSAALGSSLLVAGLHLLGWVPLAGPVVLVVLAAVGTGAVLLTGLGTRRYVPPPDVDDDTALARS